jgi:predicted phage terminase large subunit-like protein
MIRYWDLAGTEPKGKGHDPDFSAGVLACRMPDLRTAIVDVARDSESHRARDVELDGRSARADLHKLPRPRHWWIETEAGIAGRGTHAALVRRLQAIGMPVSTEHPTGKKIHRAEPLASKAEAGNVVLECPGEWRMTTRPFRTSQRPPTSRTASMMTRSTPPAGARRTKLTGHTIEGLVGQVFRRDPVLSDDVPPLIVEHAENIDNSGTHLDIFARGLLSDALTSGHAGILVEFPKTGGTQNAAQEKAEIRPYWVPIAKDNIVSWRTTVENGRLVLTQLVLKECQTVPDGEFGEKEQERFRVFYRRRQDVNAPAVVGFKLLEITKNKAVVVVDEGMYPTQDEIPVAEVQTSGRKALFESDPPLYDLACVNITHYQTLSDYLNSLHLTCVPILTLLGFDEPADGETKKVVVGPSTFIRTSNAQAKVEYVSHDGASLGSVKQALDDLKSDMGTLGLAMLSPAEADRGDCRRQAPRQVDGRFRARGHG